jgi:nucleoside-triphosphatase THEP1
MQMLYDSDSFVVVHMQANEVAEGETARGGERHGFEIVDKRSNKEVYLDGAWAEVFQRQINAWQLNVPTQEEVEEILDTYASLAQNPLVTH